ncbi:Rieske 2Fe-2S domain-containing protein [bacterium]|jgi:nitrite reductase/ring-hydroxylating ferredoxin subunit|nr:Rieske 2Fe-2S domain-containing protein [bacterium]
MTWTKHPDCPPAGTYLCNVDDIPDTGGFEVIFGEGKEKFRILLLRRGDEFWCYVNNCPHFSLPLNYQPQTFVTFDGMLVCAHHTAFFKFEDGSCVDGPCTGQALTVLPAHRVGMQIFFGPEVPNRS